MVKRAEDLNYLLDTTDAQQWAQEFMDAFVQDRDKIDEGLMIAWFANAIETGRRAGEKMQENALERAKEEMVAKTVAQQEAKIKAYDLLKEKDLPIPSDLRAEIEGHRGKA